MYAELHCHSHYSLLDGAAAPEALVARAVELGLPALALTDHDGLYGAVAFWRAARAQGVQPIIGAELTLAHGSHLTLLAENQAGYANLSRLISRGQLAGSKGHPMLTIEEMAQHSAGLLCLTGCRRGAVARDVQADDPVRAGRSAGSAQFRLQRLALGHIRSTGNSPLTVRAYAAQDTRTAKRRSSPLVE